MAGPSNSTGGVFDVHRIRRLVKLMNEHELAEIDLRQGDQRIRLRRGHEPVLLAGPPPHAVPAGNIPPVPPASSERSPAADQKVEESRALFITSPMVGTYYGSPNPEAAPFVNVGDQVGPDTVVCIIEAMKVFNEIQAECSGRIAAVLVENGAPVEFGQELFRVDP
jgi:acetyl-CoA carboxylase biotin carboxyl carrier protein